MRYGHYSEAEFEKIKNILAKYEIQYFESVDQSAVDGINESMNNTLRYFHGATICNDIIVFDMEDSEWEKIDKDPDPNLFRRKMDDNRNGGLGKVFFTCEWNSFNYIWFDLFS